MCDTAKEVAISKAEVLVLATFQAACSLPAEPGPNCLGFGTAKAYAEGKLSGEEAMDVIHHIHRVSTATAW